MNRSTLIGRGRLLAPRACLLLSIALSAASPAIAGETVTYSYDAKGRLTNVAHSGTVNNGVVSTYALDKADNRTAVIVTGASQRMVVVPLNGLTLIPLTPS